jgi:hypothetical protein
MQGVGAAPPEQQGVPALRNGNFAQYGIAADDGTPGVDKNNNPY